MNEADARAWVERRFDVSRETMGRLDLFVQLLREENGRQNLVSVPSLDFVWNRHIADSAQLLLHASKPDGSWVDLGSGPGLPGLVVALLHGGRVALVEERKMRVDFLRRAAAMLCLGNRVEIVGRRVQVVEPAPFDVISARAFAPLGRLLALGQRFAASGTRWVLPKGRNAQVELDAISASWQGDFRLEPSLTDADAKIIVAERVRGRGKGTR